MTGAENISIEILTNKNRDLTISDIAIGETYE